MCWRICPNNTAKDNRDYKGIKKLHLETDMNSLPPLWRPQKLFTWTWQQFFHNSVSLSTIIFSVPFILAIMKLCKSSKKKKTIPVLPEVTIKFHKIQLCEKCVSPKYLFLIISEALLQAWYPVAVSSVSSTTITQRTLTCVISCIKSLFECKPHRWAPWRANRNSVLWTSFVKPHQGILVIRNLISLKCWYGELPHMI